MDKKVQVLQDELQSISNEKDQSEKEIHTLVKDIKSKTNELKKLEHEEKILYSKVEFVENELYRNNKNNIELVINDTNTYLKDIKLDFENLLFYYDNFKNHNLVTIENKYDTMISKLYEEFKVMFETKNKSMNEEIDEKIEELCNQQSKNVIIKYEDIMKEIEEKIEKVSHIEQKLKQQIDTYEHLDIATQEKEQVIKNILKSVDEKQNDLHLFEQNFKQIEKMNKISEKLENSKDGLSIQSLTKNIRI